MKMFVEWGVKLHICLFAKGSFHLVNIHSCLFWFLLFLMLVNDVLAGNSTISCCPVFSSSGPGEAPNNSPSILAMLETLQNAPHLEVHKDMIRWILKVHLS